MFAMRLHRQRKLMVSQKCLQLAKFARELMANYGLHDWTFGFNRRKRYLGVCFHPSWCRVGRIELSTHLVDNNGEDKVLDTLLHEIAHALAGHAAGHGPAWKQVCLSIGAKPDRCCQDMDVVMPKSVKHTVYLATCNCCNYIHKKFRMRPGRETSYHCRKCGPVNGKLVFRRMKASSQ